MFTAILALCAAPVVLLQATQNRPALSCGLTELTRAAFEGCDARKLGVVVLLRDETRSAITRGAEKSASFETTLDGGLHAIFAGLAMQLCDKDELDLDQGVGARLPELGASVGKVTLHELLLVRFERGGKRASSFVVVERDWELRASRAD